jgi:predicted ATPase
VRPIGPELEVLIGPQPGSNSPPVESLNRFHDLDRFLTCLASEENPLTLFIDDLQVRRRSFDF